MGDVTEWICPECKRPFGRVGQGHMCAQGLSIDEFFAQSHPRERPIFDIVMGHLDELGPVSVDPVSVGIFFKNGPRFAELRPMKKWVAVTFLLPSKQTSSRLSRKVVSAGGKGSKWYHVVNVESAEEIDDQLLDWLTEAYLATEL